MDEPKEKGKEAPKLPKVPLGIVSPEILDQLNISLLEHIPEDIDSPPKLIPLRSLSNEYQYVGNLGNGSFGDVCLARYKYNSKDLLRRSIDRIDTLMDPLDDARCNNKSGLVAIKTMNRKSKYLKEYIKVKELQFILAIPSHPCLVQIYDMMIDDCAFELHIIMECMHQNLYQFMRARHYKFSSGTLKSILTQLLGAITHIHNHGYFHRDVKPENILIIPTILYYGGQEAIPQHRSSDKYVIKLADYGLARSIYTTAPYTGYVATRWYRAPEILFRRPTYSQPIDIWAFGVVAIELANFSPMATGENELDQLLKTISIIGSPIPPPYDHYHPNFYYPLGGYWKEAESLAEKLKFVIPLSSGVSIYELLPDQNYTDIVEVVRSCISWDPYQRATATMLCSMSYFKDTFLTTYKSKRNHIKWKSRNQLKHMQQSSKILNGINSNLYYSDIISKQNLSDTRKPFPLPGIHTTIYQDSDNNKKKKNSENVDEDKNEVEFNYNQFSSDSTIPETSEIGRTQTQSYDNFLQENLTENDDEEENFDERNYIYDGVNEIISSGNNNNEQDNEDEDEDEDEDEYGYDDADILEESLLPLHDQHFEDYSFPSTDFFLPTNITPTN